MTDQPQTAKSPKETPTIVVDSDGSWERLSDEHGSDSVQKTEDQSAGTDSIVEREGERLEEEPYSRPTEKELLKAPTLVQADENEEGPSNEDESRAADKLENETPTVEGSEKDVSTADVDDDNTNDEGAQDSSIDVNPIPPTPLKNRKDRSLINFISRKLRRPKTARALIRLIARILWYIYTFWYLLNRTFNPGYESRLEFLIGRGLQRWETWFESFGPPPMPDVYTMPWKYDILVDDLAFVVMTGGGEEYRTWMGAWDRNWGEVREHCMFFSNPREEDDGMQAVESELESRNPVHRIEVQEGFEQKSDAERLDIREYLALQMAFNRFMAHKKWYVLLQTSTHLHNPTLIALLQRINPEREYIFTSTAPAWPDVEGSTFILSTGAMQRLFLESKYTPPSTAVRSESHSKVPTSLLARAAMRENIPLSPILSKHLPTTAPQWTRLTATNHCALLLGFQNIDTVSTLDRVRTILDPSHPPLRREDIWDLLGGKPALGEDHPSSLDIGVFWDNIGPCSTTRVANLTYAYMENSDGQFTEYDDGSIVIRSPYGGYDSTECLENLWHGPDGLLTMVAEDDETSDWGLKCRIAPWMVVGERNDDLYSYISMTSTWGMPWDEWKECGNFEYVGCKGRGRECYFYQDDETGN